MNRVKQRLGLGLAVTCHPSHQPRETGLWRTGWLGEAGRGGGWGRLALGRWEGTGSKARGKGGSLWCTRDPPTETQAQTPQPTPPRCQALGSTARPLLPVDG